MKNIWFAKSYWYDDDIGSKFSAISSKLTLLYSFLFMNIVFFNIFGNIDYLINHGVKYEKTILCRLYLAYINPAIITFSFYYGILIIFRLLSRKGNEWIYSIIDIAKVKLIVIVVSIVSYLILIWIRWMKNPILFTSIDYDEPFINPCIYPMIWGYIISLPVQWLLTKLFTVSNSYWTCLINRGQNKFFLKFLNWLFFVIDSQHAEEKPDEPFQYELSPFLLKVSVFYCILLIFSAGRGVFFVLLCILFKCLFYGTGESDCNKIRERIFDERKRQEKIKEDERKRQEKIKEYEELKARGKDWLTLFFHLNGNNIVELRNTIEDMECFSVITNSVGNQFIDSKPALSENQEEVKITNWPQLVNQLKIIYDLSAKLDSTYSKCGELMADRLENYSVKCIDLRARFNRVINLNTNTQKYLDKYICSPREFCDSNSEQEYFIQTNAIALDIVLCELLYNAGKFSPTDAIVSVSVKVNNNEEIIISITNPILRRNIESCRKQIELVKRFCEDGRLLDVGQLELHLGLIRIQTLLENIHGKGVINYFIDESNNFAVVLKFPQVDISRAEFEELYDEE